MLVSKEAQVKWNGKTRKWYEDRGYVWTGQNTLFTCKVEDIMKTSTAKVIVKCDYCGIEYEKEYRNLFRRNSINDCCRDCVSKKAKETCLERYGVDNIAKVEEERKRRSINLLTPWETIEKLFKDKNLTLLSTEYDYEGEHSVLKYICNNHKEKGVQETKYCCIRKSKHCCPYGAIEHTSNLQRKNVDDIRKIFISKDLTPMFEDDMYKNEDTKLPFICNKHKERGIQYACYNSVKISKLPCVYCREKENIQLGEMNEFIRGYLGNWKSNVKDFYNGECYFTYSTNVDIHHKYALNTIVKEVMQELNIDIKKEYFCTELQEVKDYVIKLHTVDLGVAIDKDLHILFHSLYGKTCTKDDFDEFEKRLICGEFDDFLLEHGLELKL